MSLLGKRTVSAAVLAANRMNAKKSTGPRTWRGRWTVASFGIGSNSIPVSTRVIPVPQPREESTPQAIVNRPTRNWIPAIAEPGAPVFTGMTSGSTGLQLQMTPILSKSLTSWLVRGAKKQNMTNEADKCIIIKRYVAARALSPFGQRWCRLIIPSDGGANPSNDGYTRRH